jgi:hypothetical protein
MRKGADLDDPDRPRSRWQVMFQYASHFTTAAPDTACRIGPKIILRQVIGIGLNHIKTGLRFKV